MCTWSAIAGFLKSVILHKVKRIVNFGSRFEYTNLHTNVIKKIFLLMYSG